MCVSFVLVTSLLVSPRQLWGVWLRSADCDPRTAGRRSVWVLLQTVYTRSPNQPLLPPSLHSVSLRVVQSIAIESLWRLSRTIDHLVGIIFDYIFFDSRNIVRRLCGGDVVLRLSKGLALPSMLRAYCWVQASRVVISANYSQRLLMRPKFHTALLLCAALSFQWSS